MATTKISPSLLSQGVSPNRNLIINGDMRIAQRGTSFDSTTTPANSDDTYLLDRWYLLSDGNDIVDVTQQTDGAVGDRSYIRLDVETASKKFGIAQIIELQNCIGAISGSDVVSLSFNAKVNDNSAGRLDNIKAGVVAWSGTADTVTSDIISTWNAEDTTPTLIANATFENTPADLSVTTSDARYSIENISVDTSSTVNLIVFIWADGLTGTVTDTLEISKVQLEIGSAATAFEHRDYGSEFARCERYYQVGGVGWNGFTPDNTNHSWFSGPFHTTMRVNPTASLLDDSPTIQHSTTTATGSSSSIVGSYLSEEGGAVALDGFSGLTATEPTIVAQTTPVFAFAAEL